MKKYVDNSKQKKNGGYDPRNNKGNDRTGRQTAGDKKRKK